MDFGALPAYDGQGALVPESTLRMAWFERSNADDVSAADGAPEPTGLLDRVREGEGLVYNGEGEYEN